MKWKWGIYAVLVCWIVYCLWLGVQIHTLESERDALREQVAWLYDWIDTVDSLNTELRTTLGDCNDLLMSFVPPDTTKWFYRVWDVPGLDTMPVITACTLQAWNNGVLIPFKEVDKTKGSAE